MAKLNQVCVIPYRVKQGRLEFCLVTSIHKHRWIFPKGIVEPGETREVAGTKEAWEEAGLIGELEGDRIGSFKDHKWGKQIRVETFVLRVRREVQDWPESELRERRWCSPEEAFTLLHRKKLRRLSQLASARLAEEEFRS